ncbi:caspase-1-like%2C partial [Xyrichtys novacula]|uniref:Caspase-1-like, partial n=1 Tax=Xyrichtys novacula TaxID=13765 RepID=A0AAV1FVU0_XYRNO|nr:caspase-1-like%2C partial [Xyrichtys novacula]
MADAELRRVRSKFVDGPSTELINQLLDDLLEDGVLNKGEADSIIEENNSRANRARALIDSVIRKGDRASSRMINLLHRRDSTLVSDLGLKVLKEEEKGEEQEESIR